MKKRKQIQNVSYFKRWTRTKYAIFRSLTKQISISTIALACSFLSKPVDGVAQNSTDSLSKTLKEVQISAEEPPEMLIDNALLQVTFTKTEIERVPAQALSELLEQLQGIDIRQRGPLGTQADISYRGGNFDQTMVLLNGINFTDPQTGHYTLNLPITPGIINKIELYNNTTAFLFGASPFSGLLNIVVRPEETNSVSFYLTGGMYGFLNTGASLNFRTGKVSQQLSVDYVKSNGYIHNTDFGMTNVYYQLSGKFKSGNLEFQAGCQDKHYGANGFYSLRFLDQYEYLKTFLSSLAWKHNGKVEWSPSIYYRTNIDRFELIKGQDPKKNNYHKNQVIGANFVTAFRTIAGKTSFSADMRIEDVVSTSLGEVLRKPIHTKEDSVDYTHRLTRANIGLSASQHYTCKGWSANLTFLLQYFTAIKEKVYFLPAADIAYHFKKHQVGKNYLDENIYLSGAGGIRTPTFTDLYYQTGDIRGNKNLLPEKAYTLEIGFDFQMSKTMAAPSFFRANVAVFNRWGLDMIDYVKLDNEQIWNTVNHTSVLFTGLEISSEYKPQIHFNPDFFISSIAFQYSYLYSNKESKGYQSRYVLDHLTHRLSFCLSHRIIKNLGIDYAFSYNKRKGEYTSYKEEMAGKLATYPAYYLLDIRLHYTYKMLNFYVEASNVLNQHYFDLGDLEQPGIWVRGGIKCNIRY